MRALRLISHLSIDVAVGAVAWAALLAWACNAPWTWAIALALGAAVWTCYALDHLIDGQRVGMRFGSSPRHRFHFRHGRQVGLGVAVSTAVGALAAWRLPSSLFLAGAALSAGLALYLATLHGSHGLRGGRKELAIAAGYCTGVGLPAIWGGNTWVATALTVQLGVVAWINVVAFAMFEREADRDDNAPTIAALRSNAELRHGMIVAARWGVYGPASAALAWHFLVSPAPRMAVAECTLVLTAAAMVRVRPGVGWLEQDERYRLIGDGLFLLPLAVLPWIWIGGLP